jgi:transcriptional regulator with XRE-family HTH domain
LTYPVGVPTTSGVKDIEPRVINPVKQFRVSRGWSIKEMSEQAGVSVSTVTRTEQGCYNEIPPRLLGFISSDYLSVGLVRSDFRRFKASQRDSVLVNREKRGGFLNVTDPRVWNTNPFVWWRLINGWNSRLSFCKDMCLHPSTVKRYDDGTAVRMPEDIQIALTDIEIDWEVIDEQYQRWRARLREDERNRKRNKPAKNYP